jgi:lactate dehydrogenase-like 2-hydroxyacid dehydrogenase
MQPSAILVNTGRGQLIDRDALIQALAAGRIAGAGLDVFHDEPIQPDDPLLGLATTVLSPHHAGQTAEVRRDGLMRTVENIANFLNGSPTNVVSSQS